MKRKSQFVILLAMLAAFSQAQDSLSLKKKVPRPHEIGLTVSTVFFMLSGVSDYSERYTNLTYRYFFKKRQAFKFFTGVNVFNANNTFGQDKLTTAAASTLYATTIKDTPSNFQVGFGYEYILGNGKLKHVLGADLLYNNKFERERFYYENVSDDKSRGYTSTRLDTGSYTKTDNYDKLGINLNYSLRYNLSKKWAITTTMLVSYKTYRRKEPQGYSNSSETNFNGLISDVSLFYRL